MQCDRDKELDIVNKRLSRCIDNIKNDIPINMSNEIKEMKLDLIVNALNENFKVAAKAAKMLNMNRTTMVSMLQNELAPLIRKRKEERKK